MKRYIFEAPIDDFLPKETKDSLDTRNIKRVNSSREKIGSMTNTMSKMSNLINSELPYKEMEHKEELIDLAKTYFFYKFPQAKINYEKGLLVLDFDFERNPQIRTTKQEVTTDEIRRAEEEDIDPETGESKFQKRVVSRNLINSMSQGSAWSQGFNAYKDMIKNLDKIDPSLKKDYESFNDLATVFYSDAESALKDMAKKSTGRVAYMDIVPNRNVQGGWILVVRAPIFPLLMHEVEKAGMEYVSSLSSPKNKTVSHTLTYATDTHKHEISNMKYGKDIWGMVRTLWSEIIGDEYRNWMDSIIMGAFNELSVIDPEQFNFIFLGEFKNNKPIGRGGILNMRFDEYGLPIYSNDSEKKEYEEYTYELFENYVKQFYEDIKKKYPAPENLDKMYEFKYYKSLGDKYYDEDDNEKALENYEMALKIKQDEEIKKRIEELKRILNPPEEDEEDDLSWF